MTGLLHPDFLELLDYTGPDFHLNWCNANDDKITDEAKRYSTPLEFAENTMVFCYQSIALWCNGIHRISLSELMRRTTDSGALSVIDVGAGGGQTGLILNHMGFDVSFADISSRSMLFLEWRLRRHNLSQLKIYVLNLGWHLIPHHHWALCFDVLEHLSVDERHAWIDHLADVGKYVMVNLIQNTGDEMSGVHFPLDFDEVTSYIQARYWCEYAEMYPDANGQSRQRLVIYGKDKS